METVTIKMEDSLAKTIEKKMKVHHYTTKTEFIREAIRDKITDLEKAEALARLEKMYGAGKGRHNISDEDIHKAREKAVKEIEKELSG